MKIKADHNPLSSLSNVASFLISSINQDSLSRRLQHPAVVPLTLVHPEVHAMRSIKRVFGKSKRATLGLDAPQSPPAKADKDKYVRRRSKSVTLPLHNYRNGDNIQTPATVSSKRAKHGVKCSDIRLVLDISSENAVGLSQHAPSQSMDGSDVASTSDDYLSDEQFGRPRTPPLLIDKQTLDQFPLPPQIHAYTSTDVRVPIFDAHEGPPSDVLLPPPPPRLTQYIAEHKATPVFRQPLSRSSSNASFSRPTATAYSTLHSNESNDPADQHYKSYPPISALTRPSYRTHHNNLSTRSLGAEVMFRAGPATHRPTVHQQSRSDLGPSACQYYARPLPDVPVDVAASGGITHQRNRPVVPRNRSTSTRSKYPNTV